MYPKNKKKFTLYKISITPNYPVCEGFILFCVDIRHADEVPTDQILEVAKKHFGFWREELQINSVEKLGKMIGFEAMHGAFALKLPDGKQITIHVLDYANGEY